MITRRRFRRFADRDWLPSKETDMLLNSIDVLVDALRTTQLLRADQFTQLVNEFAPKIDDPQQLAKHLVKLNWITQYQSKKLLAGHASDLVLGNYVILEKLGEGGMGKVYKAKQLRLNRSVALKVIHPDLVANELAMKRFQREAKVVAQLSHPNIVRLYDADQVGDCYFLAMEFIEGKDLSALLSESGPLPFGMACSFIRQAGLGLEHAHDHGLVHRDIKPSNLVVTAPGKLSKSDSGGLIKILDLGLARISPEQGSEGFTALTQDGAVVGTPDFMSPEQAKNSSDVDARSDLYSLGCTFYYLLCGQPPFPDGTVLEKLLQHQIDPPRPIQQVRPDTPDEIAQIVHKLLAKKPEDRYQTGGELAAALAPFSAFEPQADLLRTSEKLPRLTGVHEALPVPCSPIADAINPFRADTPRDGKAAAAAAAKASQPLPAVAKPAAPRQAQPAKPSPAPAPAKVKLPTPKPPPPRKSRKGGRLIALLLLLAALGGGGLAAKTYLFKDTSEENPTEETVKNDVPLPPAEMKALDFYLPPDTESVAVLDVGFLAESRVFRETLLPHYKEIFAAFKRSADVDPVDAVTRVVVSVPSRAADKPLVVIYGRELGSPKMMRSAARLAGAASSEEKIGDTGLVRDVYRFPIKKKAGSAEPDVYGAVISNAGNASALVFSENKERVLEALGRIGKTSPVAFADPSIRQGMLKYQSKQAMRPSTVWLCLGAKSRWLEPLNSGSADRTAGAEPVSGVFASFRLTETLMFEIDIEARSIESAAAAKDALTAALHAAAAANKNDARLGRLEELMTSAQPTPRKKDAPASSPHQWWRSVSSDKIEEWFAPFFEISWLNQ